MYAMEFASLEVERFAGLANALLARAEGAEVLCGLGDGLSEESHHNAASGFAANLNVEEDFARNLLEIRGIGVLKDKYSDEERKKSGEHGFHE